MTRGTPSPVDCARVRHTRVCSSRAQWALAMVVLLAGCGGPKPGLNYAGKAVPINVAFGKPAAGQPGAIAGPSGIQAAPGVFGVVPLPLPVGATNGPRSTTPASVTAGPPPPPCPEPSAFAVPRSEADTLVRKPPPEGAFPFRVTGTDVLAGSATRYTAEILRTVKDAVDKGGGTFTFTVETSGASGATFTQRFQTTTPTDFVPGEIGQVAEDATLAGQHYSFNSPKPLRLMQLRADTAVAWKDAVTDPLSQTTVNYDATIIGKARVNACGQPIDTWKVSATANVVSPNENLTVVLTTYFAPQYGGLIVEEDVSYSGTVGANQVAEGSYSATINRDPGAP